MHIEDEFIALAKAIRDGDKDRANEALDLIAGDLDRRIVQAGTWSAFAGIGSLTERVAQGRAAVR